MWIVSDSWKQGSLAILRSYVLASESLSFYPDKNHGFPRNGLFCLSLRVHCSQAVALKFVGYATHLEHWILANLRYLSFGVDPSKWFRPVYDSKAS